MKCERCEHFNEEQDMREYQYKEDGEPLPCESDWDDPLDKKATDITPFDVYSPSELGLDVW